MTNRTVRLSGIVTVAVALLIAVFGHAEAQLNQTGQWSTLPYLTPVNPIHVALLRNGKVLIVGGSENNQNNTTYKNAVWNPATGTFTQQITPWDLFCNGMSFLPDGRVIMTGGNLQYDPFIGPPWTTIFDPATEKFYPLEDMAGGRWYPTNTLLNDGGTLVFGGLDEQGNTNSTIEIYDVGGGWSPPYPANFLPGWYPRMHLLGNGKVFMSGPYSPAKTFDPSQGTWWTGGNPTIYGDSRLYGSSVLLPLHPDEGYRARIMIFGGNVSGATNTVEFIDLGVWPEQWVSKPPMSVPRVHLNAVLLPNGKILTLGGSTQFNDPATAHKNAETFDPATNTWTPSGTAAYARLYHSSALLLPDATVWVAGSNPTRDTWTPQMEIYKPPYLFTSTGALAARPAISSAPAVVGYGQNFTVGTTSAASISKVILMRPGSNTHAFDSEQRMLYTYFTKGTNTLTVTSPTNAAAAPPGYYMLFIINSSGVPSVAKFIQLMPNPTNQPPTATITNPSTNVTITPGQSVTFAGTANDPDGSIAGYSWIFPGGSPSKSNVATPGAVTFPTPGVYTVSLTVLDNLGVNNVSPPTVTVTVTGPAITASIGSPANGATVTGTVNVQMGASNIQGTPTHFLLKLDNATTLSNQAVPNGTSATYAWNTATTSNGAHTLNLTVTDGAGRTATKAINVTVSNSAPGDTTPPTVTMTAPTNGSTVSGTAVTVSANASDNVGVTSVQFKLDGVNLGAPDTAAPYSVVWNTTTASNGSHTLTAVAKDAAGNTKTSMPITVTVANGGGPSGNVVWTNPVNVAVNGNTITKNGGCSGCWDAGATSQQTITSGNGSVQFGISSGGVATVGLSAPNSNTDANAITFGMRFFPGYLEIRESGAWKETWTIAAGDVHKVAVEGGVVKYYQNATLKYTSAVAPTYPLVVDATIENTATAVQNAVMNGGSGGGDTTPPTVAVTAPAGGATVSGTTVAVTASASDNVGVTSVQFKLDGVNLGTADTTAPYSVSWNSTTASNGTHTLTAVATDAAGNTTTSAPVTVTVSNGGGAPTAIIIDNAGVGVTDATRSFTSTWCVSTATNSYGGNSLYSCGTPSATYRWTPTIPATGSYDVYVWWSSHANRSTSVPLSVVHTGGTTTKTFNQQVNGGKWMLHGRYTLAEGTAGYVQVSAANGQAAADAVQFVPVTTPPAGSAEITIDNAGVGVTDAAHSFTGTWCVSTATNSFGSNSLYSCSASATYRWTPAIAEDATYDVYVWWSSHANRSTSVPLSVVHGAGTTTKTFNQQVNGGQWVLHGRYAFAAGAGYVEVSSVNGQAAADAVRFVPIAP